MKRIVILVLSMAMLSLSASSCLTLSIISGIQQAKEQRRASGADFGYYEADLRVKTFQRISEHAALAYTGGGDVVCIVCYLGEYYDGKIITNEFIREGTYSYYATNGNKKQVLVYIDKDFYGMYKQIADEELR